MLDAVGCGLEDALISFRCFDFPTAKSSAAILYSHRMKSTPNAVASMDCGGVLH